MASIVKVLLWLVDRARDNAELDRVARLAKGSLEDGSLTVVEYAKVREAGREKRADL